jgi:hypothetical protein
MKPSNIPDSIRREIVRRKLADLEVELAGLKGHMQALPAWDARVERVGKMIETLAKWRKEL